MVMNYYFEDLGNQQRLQKILDEWVGTPFRHHCGVKGRGVDCIHFGVRVLEEVGAVPVKSWGIPKYAKDWHLHNAQELLYEGIVGSGRFDELPLLTPRMNGDLILYKFGRVTSHLAIYFDGHVYNSVTNLGVLKMNAQDDGLLARPTHLMRVKA